MEANRDTRKLFTHVSNVFPFDRPMETHISIWTFAVNLVNYYRFPFNYLVNYSKALSVCEIIGIDSIIQQYSMTEDDAQSLLLEAYQWKFDQISKNSKVQLNDIRIDDEVIGKDFNEMTLSEKIVALFCFKHQLSNYNMTDGVEVDYLSNQFLVWSIAAITAISSRGFLRRSHLTYLKKQTKLKGIYQLNQNLIFEIWRFIRSSFKSNEAKYWYSYYEKSFTAQHLKGVRKQFNKMCTIGFKAMLTVHNVILNLSNKLPIYYEQVTKLIPEDEFVKLQELYAQYEAKQFINYELKPFPEDNIKSFSNLAYFAWQYSLNINGDKSVRNNRNFAKLNVSLKPKIDELIRSFYDDQRKVNQLLDIGNPMVWKWKCLQQINVWEQSPNAVVYLY